MKSAGEIALAEVRAEIDRVDRQLVQEIAEREIWVRAAGKLKAMAPAVRDPDRVEQVVARVRQIATDLGADTAVVERTYRSMIAAFIDLELGQQGFLDAPPLPQPGHDPGVRPAAVPLPQPGHDPGVRPAAAPLPRPGHDPGVRPAAPLIAPLSVADAGEVLTLQRAACATEAQIYGDPALPPLVQTLSEVVEELSHCLGHKAMHGPRLVGAVRAVIDGDTLRIGRLTVAPDLQGSGLGTALLSAIEADPGPEVINAALFTGHLSADNLRLYERQGYVEERREEISAGLTLVHLRKHLT